MKHNNNKNRVNLAQERRHKICPKTYIFLCSCWGYWKCLSIFSEFYCLLMMTTSIFFLLPYEVDCYRGILDFVMIKDFDARLMCYGVKKLMVAEIIYVT